MIQETAKTKSGSASASSVTVCFEIRLSAICSIRELGAGARVLGLTRNHGIAANPNFISWADFLAKQLS